MRIIVTVLAVTALMIFMTLVLASCTSAGAMPNERPESSSDQTPDQRSVEPSSLSESDRPERVNSDDTGNAQGFGTMIADPHNESVFDADYDDSWVANIPDVVGGYRVLYIDTPKSIACSSTPLIGLQTPRASLDEFLADAPAINALDAALESLPGVPSDVTLSFSPGPIDKEMKAADDAKWNANRIRKGCRWGSSSPASPPDGVTYIVETDEGHPPEAPGDSE